MQDGRRGHSHTPDETQDDREHAPPTRTGGIGLLDGRQTGAAGRGNTFGLGPTPVRRSS
ncbi:hypothetical protein Pd630_LPD02170 [Rhodococcus opacus PD630]|nr:hypothetical protein Pd630_LPD02170 [Rhodococcus opacus PD630]